MFNESCLAQATGIIDGAEYFIEYWLTGVLQFNTINISVQQLSPIFSLRKTRWRQLNFSQNIKKQCNQSKYMFIKTQGLCRNIFTACRRRRPRRFFLKFPIYTSKRTSLYHKLVYMVLFVSWLSINLFFIKFFYLFLHLSLCSVPCYVFLKVFHRSLGTPSFLVFSTDTALHLCRLGSRHRTDVSFGTRRSADASPTRNTHNLELSAGSWQLRSTFQSDICSLFCSEKRAHLAASEIRSSIHYRSAETEISNRPCSFEACHCEVVPPTRRLFWHEAGNCTESCTPWGLSAHSESAYLLLGTDLLRLWRDPGLWCRRRYSWSRHSRLHHVPLQSKEKQKIDGTEGRNALLLFRLSVY